MLHHESGAALFFLTLRSFSLTLIQESKDIGPNKPQYSKRQDKLCRMRCEYEALR